MSDLALFRHRADYLAAKAARPAWRGKDGTAPGPLDLELDRARWHHEQAGYGVLTLHALRTPGLAEELGRRDLLLRIQDLQRPRVDGLVLRPGLEDRDGFRALLPSPRQRLLALNLLEPLEGIVDGTIRGRAENRQSRERDRRRRPPGCARKGIPHSCTSGS